MQEDKHDQRDQDDGFENGLVDLVDRFRDEFCRVVDDVVGQSGREILGEVLHRRLDDVGGGQGICARTVENTESDRRTAVEITVGYVVFRTKFDTRDILQLDKPSAFRSLDNDIAELSRIAEAALSCYGVLEGICSRGGWSANRTAGNLHVLLLQGLDDIARRHAVSRKLLGVQPDAQGEFALAKDSEIADAVEPQQDVADTRPGVVGDVELIVAIVRRQEVHHHHQVR